jgi:hypothetical protein
MRFFFILIIFIFSISCNFSSNSCSPIRIKITKTIQNKDASPLLMLSDSLLGVDENEIYKHYPERKNDTTLSLTNRLIGASLHDNNTVSMEEYQKLHPLLSICRPVLDPENYHRLQGSAFFGTSFALDTEKVISYFNSPEIKNRYLNDYNLHWALIDEENIYGLYATNENSTTLELDSSYIDYIRLKVNEDILCLLPGKETYYLSIHLKNKAQLISPVNNENNYYVFSLSIMDKNISVSVQGSMLHKEITFFGYLKEDFVEKLRGCYGDLLKD